MDSSTNEIITARLINWGLWSNTGGYPNLGIPGYTEILREYFPQVVRINPCSIDAEHIEYVISSLDLGNRNDRIGMGTLYAFVLRLEFIEYERPRSLKAEHVRRKHSRPCSERTFRYHLYNAKKAVELLAEPFYKPLDIASKTRYSNRV